MTRKYKFRSSSNLKFRKPYFMSFSNKNNLFIKPTKNSIKVILTEYFFESLVLLAHVLCVPYEVLYITSKNSRKYEVEPLSPSQQKNFETYFKQDLMLYDFFNQSLHRKVEEFGHDVSIFNKEIKNFI